MANFIVPDDDWEFQSAEQSYASEELSYDESVMDEQQRPVQNRRRGDPNNNSRTTRLGNNLRPTSNNNNRGLSGPSRTTVNKTNNTSATPIAIDDDDIPIIDATMDNPYDVSMSQEDALAIAQALQDNENELVREQKQRKRIHVDSDSDDDEITLRSRRKVRRTWTQLRHLTLYSVK